VTTRRLSKAAFEKRLPALRNSLLKAQTELHESKSAALVVIVSGLPTAGRSEVVNQFLEWLDPKHISVHALRRESARTKPPLWPYWNTLPARGEIAIHFIGWYDEYLQAALFSPKRARKSEARVIERIRKLEAMLPLDKVRILKLHLHVDKKTQRLRIAKLRANKMTRWRVTDEDRWLARHYEKVDKAVARCFRVTGTRQAPWHVVDGTDPQHRAFEAGTLLLKELEAALKTSADTGKHHWPQPVAADGKAFATHQQGASLEDAAYEHELESLQRRFALLTRKKAFAQRAGVFAFEGMDAAGKGGVIRRLTSALDARQYCVVSVSAPAPEELAHPYLWRFWRRVPDRGAITVFDRSWYGRVLVERVRDLTAEDDWQRAYDEIKEFELQLAQSGSVVHKFWLAVSKQEQLKRLQERDTDPLKRFKVDPEDWANRRFYAAYQGAAHEMIRRTHTDYAPWTVIEGDDKKYARLKVLRCVCESIERVLR